MKALKPTVTPAVPRLLNRIFDKVQSDISHSFIKRTLYNMAMSSKENEIKRLVQIFTRGLDRFFPGSEISFWYSRGKILVKFFNVEQQQIICNFQFSIKL
jgi:long-subunit acyl-CoA synthetase (AMP-forming)